MFLVSLIPTHMEKVFSPSPKDTGFSWKVWLLFNPLFPGSLCPCSGVEAFSVWAPY